MLENAAGFARLSCVCIRSHTKMAILGYVYILGKQTSCFPESCTSRNTTSAEFLEVLIPLRVLMYDWDPLVSCVKLAKRRWQEDDDDADEKVKWGNSNYDAFPSRELQVTFGNIVVLCTLK